MMTQKILILVAFMISLGACKKAETPPAKVETPEAAAVAELTPMTEQDVRPVLVAWQSSQNEKNFEAYSALYGTKFEGVKKEGAMVSRFDRDGWVAQQGRMFQKKVDVTMDEPSIAYTGMSAVVRFKQGSNAEEEERADRGQKVLVLEKTSAGTRIVREELSRLQAERGPDQAFNPNRWAPVLLDEFLVLSDQVDDAWIADTMRLVGEGPMIGSVAVSETWVDVAKLPLAMRSLKGRTFSVDGEKECRATVQGFRVLSRVTPHFSMVEEWQGRPNTKESQTKTAGEIVELAGAEGRVLVAKLDKRCPQGVWAQAVQDASDQIFSLEVDQPVTEEILAVAQNTAAWTQIEKQASEFGQENWFNPEIAKITIFSSGKQRFVSLSFKFGAGCGDFYAEYSAIFDMSENPRLLYDTLSGPFFVPKAVMKISGDIIFVGEDRAAVLNADGFKAALSWQPPFFDCPC
jgi:hypothetical protein